MESNHKRIHTHVPSCLLSFHTRLHTSLYHTITDLITYNVHSHLAAVFLMLGTPCSSRTIPCTFTSFHPHPQPQPAFFISKITLSKHPRPQAHSLMIPITQQISESTKPILPQATMYVSMTSYLRSFLRPVFIASPHKHLTNEMKSMVLYAIILL